MPVLSKVLSICSMRNSAIRVLPLDVGRLTTIALLAGSSRPLSKMASLWGYNSSNTGLVDFVMVSTKWATLELTLLETIHMELRTIFLRAACSIIRTKSSSAAPVSWLYLRAFLKCRFRWSSMSWGVPCPMYVPAISTAFAKWYSARSWSAEPALPDCPVPFRYSFSNRSCSFRSCAMILAASERSPQDSFLPRCRMAVYMPESSL